MTIAASVVIRRAQKTLFDETGVMWPEDELLDYLNAGVNAICANKPDAFVKNEIVALAPDSKQTIPAGGIQLLDVIRNAGGRAIRQTDRNHLDHSNPEWHNDVGSSVKHFMHDKRDPKRFYVWPRVAGGSVELSYAAHPPRMASLTSPIPVDDLYETPLHHFVCGNAYAKNSKRGDLNKANAYFTMFVNAIGAKRQVQLAFSPLTPDEAQGREATLPADTR